MQWMEIWKIRHPVFRGAWDVVVGDWVSCSLGAIVITALDFTIFPKANTYQPLEKDMTNQIVLEIKETRQRSLPNKGTDTGRIRNPHLGKAIRRDSKKRAYSEEDELDPMDPSSYSDAPRDGLSASKECSQEQQIPLPRVLFSSSGLTRRLGQFYVKMLKLHRLRIKSTT